MKNIWVLMKCIWMLVWNWRKVSNSININDSVERLYNAIVLMISAGTYIDSKFLNDEILVNTEDKKVDRYIGFDPELTEAGDVKCRIVLPEHPKDMQPNISSTKRDKVIGEVGAYMGHSYYIKKDGE